MNLAVVGSRNFTNYRQMEIYLSAKHEISKIITGNASGADSLVLKYADSRSIPVEVYPGDKVSIINNCDAVIAFWDGQSSGTQEVLQLAKKLNKKLEVVFLEKNQHESPFGYIVINK